MIYTDKPADFRNNLDVSGCFVESDGEILLLQRQDHKSEPNTWGVPGGKKNPHESIEEAMVREMREETGCSIHPKDLKFFKTVFVHYDAFDVSYHIFHLTTIKRPDISINPHEHKAYMWQTPARALTMTLMQDEDACIKLFYNL